MQKSSQRVLIAAALLVAALALYFALHQPQPSDQEQIVFQMEAARAAAQAHNAGSVMQIISADYKGHSELDGNVDELHFLLNREIGKAGKLTVTLAPPVVDVQGDSATSTGRLTVQDEASGALYYDQTLTLHWKREDGRRLLVFPARMWRVTSADFPPLPE